ncbi:MAG: hypothetical protein ACXWV9_00415 [Flavisolibacter sp.]
MPPSGYSGTPLAKKLGIKDRFKIAVLNEPDHYYTLFEDMPPDVDIHHNLNSKLDVIHYFVTEAKELSEIITSLKNSIVQNGMIWISWPKQSSKVPTDITEDVIRAIAIQNGLVDIKVCAVDNVWSALKLVIPVKERK